MKLRIRGDSIRIRVSQVELREYAERGQVSDTIHFGSGSALTYALETDADAAAPRARYAPNRIAVVLPAATVQRWAASAQVSIEGEQAVGGVEPLRILVEKDFACLQPRPHEDDTDNFPNPEAAPSCQ
jgi:Family of unknown function (DUF7009)